MNKTAAHPLHAIDQLVSLVRHTYGFRSLTVLTRRSCQGKWFATAGDFADRAAACLRIHREDLADVPFTPEQISQKRRNISMLADTHATLEQLTKEAADTLLIERAELYEMSSGVLRAVEHVAKKPFQSNDLRSRITASLRHLRHYFDKKNAKISKSRRRGAASVAPHGPKNVESRMETSGAPALPPPRR